jgi:tetratricopeptide (TPR) repeat protein
MGVVGTTQVMDVSSARIARLRGFIAQDAGNTDLACELVDALMEEGDLGAAGDVLSSLPDASRAAPGVVFRRARLGLAQGRYGDAANDCQQLIDAGIDGVAVRHDLAFSRLCERQGQQAYDIAQSAAQTFGDTVELAILRARAALMLESYALAQADIEAALSLDANRADAWGVAALVFLDAGDLPQAAHAATQALARDDHQHEALMVAGTLALWEQRLDEAQLMFERALVRHPNSGRVLSGLGQVLMLRNDLPGAVDVLQLAVVAMPDHIGTWHALAWALLLQGRTDDAEAAYHSAYALDRNFGDTHGGLALIAALRGDHAEAEQAAKRALRLDPNALTARYAQSLVLDAQGDRSGADAVIEELLSTGPRVTDVPAREFATRLRAKLQPGTR